MNVSSASGFVSPLIVTCTGDDGVVAPAGIVNDAPLASTKSSGVFALLSGVRRMLNVTGCWLGRSIETGNVSFEVPEFPSGPDASPIVIAGFGSLS